MEFALAFQIVLLDVVLDRLYAAGRLVSAPTCAFRIWRWVRVLCQVPSPHDLTSARSCAGDRASRCPCPLVGFWV